MSLKILSLSLKVLSSFPGAIQAISIWLNSSFLPLNLDERIYQTEMVRELRPWNECLGHVKISLSSVSRGLGVRTLKKGYSCPGKAVSTSPESRSDCQNKLARAGQ